MKDIIKKIQMRFKPYRFLFQLDNNEAVFLFDL